MQNVGSALGVSGNLIRAYRTVSPVLQALTNAILEIVMATKNATSRSLLTQARLKELLSYDPETGSFWSVVGRKGVKNKSTPVGCNKTDGYRICYLETVRYYEHRLAWLYVYGVWPDHVDHINGNKSDNRISNLRSVSGPVNRQNIKRAYITSTTGILGISKNKKRWSARIGISNKTICLGTFDTKKEAHEAYIVAKRRLHIGCTI